MSINIKKYKKNLSEMIDQLKYEEDNIINYRNDINEKKKDLDDSKKLWKNQVELINNLKLQIKTTKEFLKDNKRTRKESVNGLTKPIKIRKELSDFMNLEEDEYTTRNQIWKFVFSFIKKNNLLDENDKRKLKLDSVNGKYLKNLLNLNDDSTIYSLRKNLETFILKNK